MKMQKKQELIKILSDFFPNENASIEYKDLIDDLGMDSIVFISLIVAIEDYYDITIPDELLFFENFRDLDNIVEIVCSELKKKC